LNHKVGLQTLIELDIQNRFFPENIPVCKPCHDDWSLIILLIEIGKWKDFRTHPYRKDCNCVGCASARFACSEQLDIYWNKGWIDIKEKDGKMMIGKGINFDEMIKAS